MLRISPPLKVPLRGALAGEALELLRFEEGDRGHCRGQGNHAAGGGASGFFDGERRTTSQVTPAATPMMATMKTRKASRPRTVLIANLE